jgi:Raf kinase inhibitor-like YbhB/YbcL family protein
MNTGILRNKCCILVGIILVTALCLLVVPLLGCQSVQQPLLGVDVIVTVSSSAFHEGEIIPDQYTCTGDNVSPALDRSQPLSGTESLALILEDPDAQRGVFTHWILFNIPAESTDLPEAVPLQERLPDGSLQGKNDTSKTGYTGPCPPAGTPHRYRFTVYPLDTTLDLGSRVSKQLVLDAMSGHILAQGTLTGRYQR